MSELTIITLPYDFSIFTMGIGQPYATSRINAMPETRVDFIPQYGTLDLASVLCITVVLLICL
jgi:hypothetical protein